MIQEPDEGFNPFQMAPRLMMNMADVAKTGAVQPGSRVAWRYKFAGDAEQLANYEQWLLPKLGPQYCWIGLDQDAARWANPSDARSNSCCYLCCWLLLLAVAAVAVAMSRPTAAADVSGRHTEDAGPEGRSCASLSSANGCCC